MSIVDVLEDIRKNISPNFVYDEKKVEQLRAEKEKELQDRINEAIKNHCINQNDLKYSMIPEKYQKSEFTDLTMTDENKVMIETVVKFVKNFDVMRKGICLMGAYGIGKTSLMAIACKKLIEEKDKKVYFATEQTILEEIKKTFNNTTTDGVEDVIRRICKHDVIVIDELGTTRNDWELSVIKRIIDGAIYGNKRLLVTTNYGKSELLERWGQSDTYKTPKQVIDRMNEAMDLYEVTTTKSYR